MFKKILKIDGTPIISASAVAFIMGAAGASMPMSAEAGLIGGGDFSQTSRIDTDVSEAGIFKYTVNNTSQYGGGQGQGSFDEPFIVDWEMPFNINSAFQPVFDIADQSNGNVRAPTGWEFGVFEIGKAEAAEGWGGIADWQTDGDPFNDFLLEGIAGNNSALPANLAQAMLDATHVMRWFIRPDDFFNSACDGSQSITVTGNGTTNCNWSWDGNFTEQGGVPDEAIPYGGTFTDVNGGESSLSGFELHADNGESIPMPYQASWAFLPVVTGDPPGPNENSPNNVGINPTFVLAAPTVDPNVTPEPGSLALLATGLLGGAVVGLRRRRSKKQH